ncbi:oligosaccharyltransferase complex subunit ostc-A-like protein [Dinothrombium tinctorium]|uniref:Oligosaccharyltransferase complex subunit n=1 Tax=Dinothrombium tinctorium TaxID=1965070 RepID=A0A3S3NQM8_9ACAR|nr:oligosaccharyltransferase complex subunit ostc-A-like protein [Dinothrombium tinctorium]
MIEFLFELPFNFIEAPNLKLKKPVWLHKPSAMFVYSLVMVSYFLVCAGVIYDVIVEPPSIGSTVDASGHSRPVAFMPYRVNGQYIMEGLASSFLFTIGGLGFVILDSTHSPLMPRLNRILLISIGFMCIIVSFITTWIFMRMKLPGYLL